MSQKKNEPESYSPIHTICGGCVFQEMEGKAQVGCSLGRIDDYRNAGTTILNAINEDDEEFFIIDERMCAAKRPPYWKRKVEEDGKDVAEQVYKELEIAYHSIIILEDGDLSGLQNSIESLKSQSPSPKHITIVKTQDSKVLSSDLRTLIDEYDTPWKVQVLTERMPHAEAADLVLSAPLPAYPKNLQLYMCIDSGDILPELLMEKLNYKINRELLQFAILELKPDTHSIIAPISVHKFVGGNRLKEEYGDDKTTLKEEIQKDEECKLRIMSLEEVL